MAEAGAAVGDAGSAADPGPRTPQQAVIDTSVILMPFTDGLDLLGELERLVGECEPVVPSSIYDEVGHLARGDGATARAANAALRWVQDWPRIETTLPGDDGALDVARRLGALVVTNDKSMQAEAARSGLRVLAPRGHGLAWV